jgi:hypothetical protein
MPPARVRSSNVNFLGICLIAIALAVSGCFGILVVLRTPGNGDSRIVNSHELLAPGRRSLYHQSAGDVSLQHTEQQQQQQPCPACPTCSPAPVVVSKPPEVLSTSHYLKNPRKYHVVTTTAGFSNHWQVCWRALLCLMIGCRTPQDACMHTSCTHARDVTCATSKLHGAPLMQLRICAPLSVKCTHCILHAAQHPDILLHPTPHLHHSAAAALETT